MTRHLRPIIHIISEEHVRTLGDRKTITIENDFYVTRYYYIDDTLSMECGSLDTAEDTFDYYRSWNRKGELDGEEYNINYYTYSKEEWHARLDSIRFNIALNEIITLT